MRTVIPGSVSSQYIQALKENQIDFLRSFTASDETSQRAREAWPLDGTWRPPVKKSEG